MSASLTCARAPQFNQYRERRIDIVFIIVRVKGQSKIASRF